MCTSKFDSSWGIFLRIWKAILYCLFMPCTLHFGIIYEHYSSYNRCAKIWQRKTLIRIHLTTITIYYITPSPIVSRPIIIKCIANRECYLAVRCGCKRGNTSTVILILQLDIFKHIIQKQSLHHGLLLKTKIAESNQAHLIAHLILFH